MIPVHRGNIPLANECLNSLLNNSDLNIICIDDFGNDKDYVQNERIKFIHNSFTERQPLVKIWNQCIKECPTDNVIIASWRQRPTPEHFRLIEEKLTEGYGMVTFDELHFFGFNKHLMTRIGFFDEGFTSGQYEDTDWFNRLKTNNIAIYMGPMSEQRHINGQYVASTWADIAENNRIYYHSKWTEDANNKTLIQKKDELNYSDRELYKSLPEINYKPWTESVLAQNLISYFGIYEHYVKSY